MWPVAPESIVQGPPFVEAVGAMLWAVQEKWEKEQNAKTLPKFGPLGEGADGLTCETLG